jgi:hypothetical protein
MSINRDVFISSSSSMDHVQVLVLNGMVRACSRNMLAHSGAIHGIVLGGLAACQAMPFSKPLTIDDRDREFVRLEEDFKAEIERKEIDLGEQKYTVFQNIRQYAASLLELKPAAISVQATYDRSVLFTVKVGDHTGYFEYFIDYSLASYDDPMDEMVLNIYINKDHKLNFSGEFYEAFEKYAEISEQKKHVPIPVTA